MAATSSVPRVFRVFVSSTFDDLVAERDALQRGVVVDGQLREGAFARLRRLCEAHGARFQAIDLRWGVSEEAAYDQRTVPLCLAEVERCRRLSPRPSFLAILGDRYGWRPLPWTLTLDEWEAAQAALTGAELDLVRQWYRQDDNQVPPVAVLQPRDGASRDPQAWREIEDALRDALQPVTGTSLSATEQEMRSGVLLDAAGSEAGFAFLRTIDGLPDDACAAPYVDVVDGQRDTAAGASVAALRTQLREQMGERVHEYTARWVDGTISTDHLARLNDDVYDALARAIETELEQIEALDPLDVERETHARFAADRCAHLVGRAGVLTTVATRREQANRPVVVWGAAGSGKSAVLAESARTATGAEPAAVVVCRFVGATPASSVGPQLLRSIWAEIDRAYGVKGLGAPGDDTVLLSRFPEQLRLATEERPLLVLVDGLDQLPDHDPVRRLTWLPDYLPQHAWVAVSTRPGAELDRLRGRLGEEQTLEVPGLSPDDGTKLLSRWLADAGRTLGPDQETAVLTAFEASGGLPLHLRLSAEEAKAWPSWQEPPQLPVDVPSLIDRLFARLAQEDNHGAVLVGRALGLLAASRDGLTEDELLDLLSGDLEVMSDFVRRSPRSPTVERLPVVVWSRLFADLEPYLTSRSADGTVTIGFYHRELADASARAFLSDGGDATRHVQLATYFSGLWQRESDVIPLRALAELPFHLARSGQLDAATDLLTDPAFVAAKVRASGLPSLLEDLDEIHRQGGDDAALPLLREALLLSVEALTRDREQLSGQLVGRLGLVADRRIQLLVGGLRDVAGGPRLGPTTASLTPPGEPLVRILRGREPASAVALSADGRLVAAGSFDRDLRVWDLATGLEVVHTLGERPGGFYAEGAGGDEILDLRFTEGGLLAVSADRCVYVVDLRAGVARTAVDGETDNLYKIAIVDDDRVLSAPHDVWGVGATSLQVWQVLGGEPRDVPGLEGYCAHLAVSADGGTALTVDREGPVVRWDLRAGTVDERWRLPETSALALSPDGASRAIAAADGTIVVGGPAGDHTLTGHVGAVRALLFARPDLLVSAGSDGTVRLWDLGVGRELRCLRGHGTGVVSVAVSADARTIVSGGSDGAVHVWDLGRAPIAVLGRPPSVHAASVVGASLGDDGSTAATAGADDSLLRWDLVTGAGSPVDAKPEELDQVAGRSPVPEELSARAAALDEEAPRSASDATHTVTAVAVSADGHRAVTASSDNIMVFYRLNVTRNEARVRLWDLASGNRLRVLSFREESGVSYRTAERCRCAALDATGTFGCTGGDDRTLQVWHLDSGARVAALTLDAPVTACAMSSDGTSLVAGDASGRVHLLRLELDGWEPASTESSAGTPPVALDPQSGERWGGSVRSTGGVLASDQGWVESVAVSPDGERALVGGADGSVVRWNLVDRRHESLEPAHADWACTVGYSVDGRRAASGSADGTVRLWEAATGGHVDTLTDVPGGAWSLLGLPDGRRWLVGDGVGDLLVWEPESDGPPNRFPVHAGAVTAMVRLGGTSVASASVDGSLAVTDVETGTVSWRSSPGTPVWSLALVGGDVCAGRHTALETWDVVTGQLRWSLETGHRAAIAAVAATADGERVVTGSVDGEVRITDTSAGRPLGLVRRTGWPVNAVTITSGGESALVAGHGGEVHVVPLAEEPELVEDTIRARFTDAEWDVVRRLPGIVGSFVAGADGKVTPEEALQMHPHAERHVPTGTAARDFAALVLEDPAIDRIVEPGALQDPAAARYDGEFGLSRAVLRRHLCDEEYREVVEVLVAAAREVAARSRRILGNDVSSAEEEALRTMEGRF